MKVWDAEQGEELKTLRGRTGTVYGLSFSPDGKRIVSGVYFDRAMIVWPLEKLLNRTTSRRATAR